MRIVPDSTVSLYSGVQIDGDEQLVFRNKTNQTAYFQSKLVRQTVNCPDVRKTGILRLEVAGSVVATCNYLSFINPSFDNKIVYARILDYDYINNECVEIAYEIDYWQTWMFDVTFDPCYIEREHLSQADFTRAESNPYLPDIIEFRTSESLPYSTDLEKHNYSLGTDSDPQYDGYLLGEANPVYNTMGTLWKLTEIDFEDLDDGASSPTPSSLFVNNVLLPLLDNGITGEYNFLGFYCLTKKMYDYLNTHYSTDIQTQTALGNSWGSNLTPFNSSKFNANCCYLYNPLGGTVGDSVNSELLKLLTSWSDGDPSKYIIDVSVIPTKMMWYAGRSQSATYGIQAVQSLPTMQVRNKKLWRYPFSYMRAITPNGDIKEFQYDRFSNIIGGDTTAYFYVSFDFSDKPRLVIAPWHYEMADYNGSVEGLECNIIESLQFDQFPTMPYIIDAFYAQTAAVANQTIANRTMDTANELSQMDAMSNKTAEAIQTIGDIGGKILSVVGSASGESFAVGSAGNMLNTSSMYGKQVGLETQRRSVELARDRWKDATNVLSGKGSFIASQLQLTKPAYACNIYHQSNGVGTINFNRISFCDVILLRVSLDPTIMSMYDRYFDLYGYNSGRMHVPYVVWYTKGETSVGLLPHWANINNQDTTYIKTMDCKVTHSMLPVADAIRNMFNAGVRMIKGDLT